MVPSSRHLVCRGMHRGDRRGVTPSDGRVGDAPPWSEDRWRWKSRL